MKKKTIRAKLFPIHNWTYGVTIAQIREDLDKFEKLGVTEINIESEEEYGSAYVKIEAIVERLETDEEFNIRNEKEKKRKLDIEAMELAQLSRLKAKYKQ